mmetsp:Transcript_50207/g.148128  ORF Transcript_50207/g.148128 Transcript_50207/m.148128 type:complete len:231 (+) Transcript_50207:91-783(+)
MGAEISVDKLKNAAVDSVCGVACGLGRTKDGRAAPLNSDGVKPPPALAIELEHGLPMSLPNARPESLTGTWKFEREIGSVEKLLKAMGVPWVMRKLILSIQYDYTWYIDAGGSVPWGTIDGQPKQLVRNFVHSGSPVGTPEAFPIGEFAPVNPQTKQFQQVSITWENGRLERRTIDESLPAGCMGQVYGRFQSDGTHLVEICCLGPDDEFIYAKVFTRVSAAGSTTKHNI